MGRNKEKKKVEFQVSPELYERLRELAEKEDRSIASYIRYNLTKQLNEESGDDDGGGEGADKRAAQ